MDGEQPLLTGEIFPWYEMRNMVISGPESVGAVHLSDGTELC